MNRLAPVSKDYYADNWYSDEENPNSSSDEEKEYDEIQSVMAKVAGVECRADKKKRKALEAVAKEAPKLSEFECDMEKEMDAAFNWHKDNILGHASCFTREVEKHGTNEKVDLPIVPSSSKQTKPRVTFKDADVVEKEVTVIEDLLYDPKADLDNEAWVKAHVKSAGSDAVLNCPACMALLSLDCQRHAIFKTQYRAMFVHNCHVNHQERMYVPTLSDKKLNRKRKLLDDEESLKEKMKKNEVLDLDAPLPENVRPEDLFHPVLCSICRTNVGVYDNEEIYHFFNVLSSHT